MFLVHLNIECNTFNIGNFGLFEMKIMFLSTNIKTDFKPFKFDINYA